MLTHGKMRVSGFRVRGQCLIGASFTDGTVAVVNFDQSALFGVLQLEANWPYCFAVSEDGLLIATGYGPWPPARLDIWDLAGGTVASTIENTSAFDVTLSHEHRYVIWRGYCGRHGAWIRDLRTSRTEKLKGAGSPCNGSWTRDGKALLLPMWQGKGGLRINIDPFEITPLPLPNKHRAWIVACNPRDDTIAMLENGRVSCLQVDDCGVLWKRALRVGWLAYTGDGRFIALEQNAPGGGAPERIIVLDALSGEIARTIEQPEQARYPLAGPKMLCLSGRIANLETGEVEDGVSDIKWWNSLLRERDTEQASGNDDSVENAS
jgi:hypothetical protein